MYSLSNTLVMPLKNLKKSRFPSSGRYRWPLYTIMSVRCNKFALRVDFGVVRADMYMLDDVAENGVERAANAFIWHFSDERNKLGSPA